jgi:hypothetical protein
MSKVSSFFKSFGLEMLPLDGLLFPNVDVLYPHEPTMLSMFSPGLL